MVGARIADNEADGLRFNGYVVEFENSHEPT